MILFETEYSGELYQKVLQLAGIFSAAGGRAVLVGGAVRDALMGEKVKDFDLEVHDLSPERVLSLLADVCEVDTVGMSFGVIKVKHLDLDISLPRRENKNGIGHRGFLVEPDPGLDFRSASARRDFTVNAIMYDPLNGEIIDPHNGIADIEQKILRHVSSHFSEDPLRVLRGMQFAARMGFSAAPETLQLCAELDQDELAVERIGTEWEKLLLQGKNISAGLEFLDKCRWIRFYPELEVAYNSSRKEFICNMTDAAACYRSGNRQSDLVFMGAAFCACLAESVDKCAEVSAAFCSRLWSRRELIKEIILLAETLRQWVTEVPGSVTAAQCRRISYKLGGLEKFIRLLHCAGAVGTARNFTMISQHIGVLDNPPVPLVCGKDGIACGVKPGPELGKYLKLCFDAQLEGEFFDTQSGIDYLKKLIKRDIQ